MRSEPDTIIFETTGREEYANNRIVGIDHTGRVSDGYDGDFAGGGRELNKEEKWELAEYMILLWADFGKVNVKY